MNFKLLLPFVFLVPAMAIAQEAPATETPKEVEYEIVKIKPVSLSCVHDQGGGKTKKRDVKVQDCWMEAKAAGSKKAISIYLDIAKCQGKPGEKISLDLVEHTCPAETPKLQCKAMDEGKSFVIDRLIDQSYEIKICNSGKKKAWLEKTFANRSEVKY